MIPEFKIKYESSHFNLSNKWYLLFCINYNFIILTCKINKIIVKYKI